MLSTALGAGVAETRMKDYFVYVQSIEYQDTDATTLNLVPTVML